MNNETSLDYQLYVQREMEFSHSPYEYERSFYENVKQGNIEEIKENHRKYSEHESSEVGKGTLSPDPLKNQLYHMIINTAIITRVCISAGLSPESAYTLSDMYIRKADKCNTVNHIRELNDKMVLEFAQQMRVLNEGKIHSHTIKAAVNFICDNLHEKISTEQLAKKFGYNRSYFSTLFKKETGFSISKFIMKKRIDTASNILSSADFTYSQIALALGFSSQSHFCKCFKEHAGTTPRAFRNG